MNMSDKNNTASKRFYATLASMQTPCSKFNCTHVARCSDTDRPLACDAWRHFVSTGIALAPTVELVRDRTPRTSYYYKDAVEPDHDTFLRAERDWLDDAPTRNKDNTT